RTCWPATGSGYSQAFVGDAPLATTTVAGGSSMPGPITSWWRLLAGALPGVLVDGSGDASGDSGDVGGDSTD
ncbi:hypothetical protein Dimus_015910, partial [Dionaea muscipula]